MMRTTTLLASFLAISAAAAPDAWAQSTQVPLGSFTHDTTQPVEIAAERLTVDPATGISIFSGGVVVGQGSMRLSADEVQIEYSETADGGRGGISRLLASGGVTLSTEGEAAEAREAVYTVADGLIELSGDVLLTQGGNALAGDRLVVDLTSGSATMDGRVRTVIESGRD